MNATPLSITLDSISSEACWLCEVSDSDLRSHRRHPAIVLARRLIVAAARRHTRQSYIVIQRYTGPKGSCHSASIERMKHWPANLKANLRVEISPERAITPQEAWDHMERWAAGIKAQAPQKLADNSTTAA